MSKLSEGVVEQKAKREIDWAQIQNHYRVGLLSVREIASSQGISHTAIQNRAKAYKWERDLKAKVNAKANALVARHEVSNLLASETGVSENLIVEINAKVIADIRLEHRAYITKLRRLTMTMLAQLEVETDRPELFEQRGELLIDTSEEDSKEYQAKRMDALNKAISLANRINNLKALSESLRTLIALERQAYGIIDEAPLDTSKDKQEQLVTYDAECWASDQKRITERLGIRSARK
jgi:transposase